ncbi:MAG: hypothetical protein D6722_09210 [Bacteroidetes bacterium]|nr:MAG: hypothetical protein D6722_09210 [Bacteroidota bacterium]
MKTTSLIWIALLGLGLSACTGPRYASTVEYDDVYYTRADHRVETVAEYSGEPTYETDRYDDQTARYREPVDSYQDYYYGDDDFTFSRRIRRFNQSNGASWRYYDPYFSNDLYYVMGTPYWNRWNNMGWYNWNRPRFGSMWAWNDPFMNPYRFGGMGFSMGMGAGMSFGWNDPFWGYDPWVASYYGYNPAFMGGLYNPYSAWNNGFYSGYASAWHCPPTGFMPFNSWNRYNTTTQRYVTTRPRATAQSLGSQTNYTPRQGISNTRPTTTTPGGSTERVNNRTDYLRPRPAAQRQAINTQRTSAPANVRPSTSTSRPTTVRRSNAPVYTRPGTTHSNTLRQGTTTRPSTVTRPGTATRPNTTVSPNRRNYSSPSRPTTPTRRPPTINSSPRNNSGSFNSSRPSSSFSSPSRNSSGSFNSGSFSSPRSSSSPRTSSGTRRN